jgi:hypothetical protein
MARSTTVNTSPIYTGTFRAIAIYLLQASGSMPYRHHIGFFEVVTTISAALTTFSMTQFSVWHTWIVSLLLQFEGR